MRSRALWAVVLSGTLSLGLAACGGGAAVSVFGLEAGDCFDDPDGQTVEEVPAVDCAEPHDNEVFALVEHPAGGDAAFPGRDAVIATAEELCAGPFEEYVGRSYEESRLYLFPITPSQETWAEGDREIVCALYEQDEGKMRGSRRDSAV